MSQVAPLPRGLSRRQLIRTTALAGLLAGPTATLLSACGGKETPTTNQPLTADQVAGASGQIKMLGWQFYQDDATQNAGAVKAAWTYISSSGEIPTRIKAPHSFDAFNSNSNGMNQFLAIKRLAPIPTNVLTNYAAIAPALRDDPLWRDNGQVYAVPFADSFTGLGWNSTVVPEPTSLHDLLKPGYRKSVGMLDDPTVITQIARGLGFDKPYLIPKDRFAEIRTFMNKLRPQIKTLHHFGDEVQLFARKDISVEFPAWAANIVTATKSAAGLKYNFVGAVSFVDSLSIVADGNQAAALRWIDQAIGVAAQRAMAKSSLAYPVVDTAKDALPADLATLSLSDLISKAPILGPSPLIGEPNAEGMMTVQDLSDEWTKFKAGF